MLKELYLVKEKEKAHIHYKSIKEDCFENYFLLRN